MEKDTTALIRSPGPFNSSSMRMPSRHLRSLGLGLALLAALGSGCGKEQNAIIAVAETDEPQYQSGEQMLREEHPDEALTAFLAVIKSREDDAPESHLEAGRIYLTNKNDPISAIYHFKAYLVAKPNSDQAPMVKELINTAQKDYARSLPGAPNIYDEVELLDQITALKAENENLRHELGLGSVEHLPTTSLASIPSAASPSVTAIPLNNNPSPPPVVARQPTLTPTPVTVTAAPAPTVAASGRTYTVASGDTLSSISMKVFGTRNRWKEIYNLNRDLLPNSDSTLHIGQVLKLPAQ